jgi:uncharacterized protein YjbI with pentapeptide repeats
MANEEHLARLMRGVESWNRWRKSTPEIIPDLSKADLSNKNFSEANFTQANFSGANFTRANLSGANLNNSDFSNADLSEANLSLVRFEKLNKKFGEINDSMLDYLNDSNWWSEQDSLYGSWITTELEPTKKMWQKEYQEEYLKNLKKAKLSSRAAEELLEREHLKTKTTLVKTNLSRANLKGINLFGAELKEADLRFANLSEAQALYSDFEGALLTGACIEDWNINAETNLNNIICHYVFLKGEQQERRPLTGTFKLGEFTTLLQKAQATLDLIFTDGIDWKAFFVAFQEVQTEYQNSDLIVQAIERKSDQAFVIRLEVNAEVNKENLENRIKKLYEEKVKILESQYEQRLKLQGAHLEDARRAIDAERQENATLIGVISTMSSNQKGPTYNLQGSKFGGGFAAEGGFQAGGNLIDLSSASNLTDAAQQIQDLLQQLQGQGVSIENAKQQAASDLAKQAEANPTVMGKLVKWGQSLADTASKTTVSETAKGVVKLALQMSGVSLP